MSKDKVKTVISPCNHTEAVESSLDSKRDNVASEAEKPSEGLYKGQEGQLRAILSKHGVLTNDGWKFVTDELVKDLMKWKTK